MSLVLEALRRVEKTDGQKEGAAVAMSPARPSRDRPRVAPLLLGLLTGGALLLIFVPPKAPVSRVAGLEPLPPGPKARQRPSLPPMKIVAVSAFTPVKASPAAIPAAPPTPEPLVLQAISQRDSKPVAIINDQLVREGDRVGRGRVVRIGQDTVDVIKDDGTTQVVRFALPPEATPSPTP